MLASKNILCGSLLGLLGELYDCNNDGEGFILNSSKKDSDLRKKKWKMKMMSMLIKPDRDLNQKDGSDLTELDDLTWISYILMRNRQFDEAKSMTSCIKKLDSSGVFHEHPDMPAVLRFLICLSNIIGKRKKRDRVFSNWKIDNDKEDDIPNIPLNFGETTIHRTVSNKWFYTHYPKNLFCCLPNQIQENSERPVDLNLCEEEPGSQWKIPIESPLETGSCMNALLQPQKKPVAPDTVLSIPTLPEHGGSGRMLSDRLRRTQVSSNNSQTDVDEGYASSQCSGGQSTDIFSESVLDFSFYRLCVDQPFYNKKHLPFITEAPANSVEQLWAIDQNLWGSLTASTCIPAYAEISSFQVCRDSINLLMGVSSQCFPYSQANNTFTMKEGLCFPGITPSALLPQVQIFLDAGNCCKRLEELTSFRSQKGLIWQSFSTALKEFLQLYRSRLLLMNTSKFLELKAFTQPYIEMLIFVYKICYDCSGKGLVSLDGEERSTGMSLIAMLFNQLFTTQVNRDSYLLLFLLKRSIAPLFRYLERWMYLGEFYDPYNEFMIFNDSNFTDSKDRKYWTKKYTLLRKKIAFLPSFLQTVLCDVFACGKTVNFLQAFAPKHSLFKSSLADHPRMDFCVSADMITTTRCNCQLYVQEISNNYTTEEHVNFRVLDEKIRLEQIELQEVAKKQHAFRINKIKEKQNAIHQEVMGRKEERLKQVLDELDETRKHKLKLEEQNLKDDLKIHQEYQNILYKKELEEQQLRQEIEDELNRATIKNKKNLREIHLKKQGILDNAAQLSVIEEQSCSSNLPSSTETLQDISSHSDVSQMSISESFTEIPASKDINENPTSPQADTNINQRTPSDEADINSNPRLNTLENQTTKQLSEETESESVLGGLRKSDSNETMHSVESIANSLHKPIGSMKKSKSETFSQNSARRTKKVERPHSVACSSDSVQLLTDNDVSRWPEQKTDKTPFSDTELLSARNLEIPSSVRQYEITPISKLDPGKQTYESENITDFVPNYILRGMSIHVQSHVKSVNEAVLTQILVKDGLLKHFTNLQQILLHQDGAFSRTLAASVSSEFGAPNNLLSLLTPAELNPMLNEAVASSQCAKDISEHLSFVVTKVPHAITNLSDFWDCLKMNYQITWPHTVILDSHILQKYSDLWRFFMKLHQAVHSMNELFRVFSICGKTKKNSRYRSQISYLCVLAHEARQFIRVILCYISHQVIQTSVSEFEKRLKESVHTIDDLYEEHCCFVDKMMEMSFLTEKGAAVHNILEELFRTTHQFSSVCLSAVNRGYYDVDITKLADSCISKFRDMQKFFTKLLLNVSKYTRIEYLEALVLQLSFNENYSL